MTKQEIVLTALQNYGTSSAKQLSCYIKRVMKEDISPSSAAGQLRSLFGQGKVCKCDYLGQTVYWVPKA